MALTLGNWLFIVIAGLLVGLLVFAIACSIFEGFKTTILSTIIFLLVWNFGCVIGLNWYNTSTASGIRSYKDFQSELTNGLNREITITAEDGREIFHYEGKVDIESNHEDNYIKFEGEDGKRYMIYYGIQDTITIIEK